MAATTPTTRKDDEIPGIETDSIPKTRSYVLNLELKHKLQLI